MVPPSTKQIVYSIFIENVDYSITNDLITKEFNQLNLGTVEAVEMIEKRIDTWQKKNKFWQVRVYFSTWNEVNPYAVWLRSKLDSCNNIKIVHNYYKNTAGDVEQWTMERGQSVINIDLENYDCDNYAW